MHTKSIAVSACLALIASFEASAAFVTYEAGQVYKVTSPVVAEEIRLDGELRIKPGGTVIGTITEGDGHLVVDGGTLVGGTFWWNGTTTVKSGTVTGQLTGYASHGNMLVPDIAISGGSVLGGISVDNQFVEISGGYVGNKVEWIFADFAMTDGVVDGRLWSDAAWNVSISGGLVTGSMYLGDYNETGGDRSITGGTFTGTNLPGDTPLLSLYTSLNIFGGSFATNTFLIGEFGQLNIFGTGFSYTDGILSGLLRDGSQFSQRIVLENGGKLNIVDVPEPSTLGLFGISLLGLALGSRGRASQAARL